MSLSIVELQQYIKQKDFKPDEAQGYFYKLIEEVGELSEALRKDKRLSDKDSIKGTVEEELYDVLYYVMAVANIHDIDMEQCFHLKEAINQEKYPKR